MEPQPTVGNPPDVPPRDYGLWDLPLSAVQRMAEAPDQRWERRYEFYDPVSQMWAPTLDPDSARRTGYQVRAWAELRIDEATIDFTPRVTPFLRPDNTPLPIQRLRYNVAFVAYYSDPDLKRQIERFRETAQRVLAKRDPDYR